MKYKNEIKEHSQTFAVSPALVASIINVESGFKDNRESPKGARGLMQIMPSTAEWIAVKLNDDFNQEDLFDHNKNIRYGTFYLSYLFDVFESLEMVICAYNAGMGNVKKWIEDKKFYNGEKFIKIPFRETENYLQKVLKNLSYYKKKY